PALTPKDAEAGAPVTDERSVLCAPGDVAEFVAGVTALASRPEMSVALGANARAAARDHYSWERHVANLWVFLTGSVTAGEITSDLRRKRAEPDVANATVRPSGSLIPPEHIVRTGDTYKDQVQRQWNNDPAGSHYVSEAPKHTKEWFLE